MASARHSSIEQEPVRPVTEAVQEYRVIEDGALAYHLQEREIEHHYACNVENRRTVMQDIRTAQQLQDEEDRRARIFTLEQQAQLEKTDEKLAEAYQEKLFKKHLQEEQERKEREERDNEIAFMLMERERRRERRQQAVDRDLAEKMSRMPTKTMERMKKMTDEELAQRLQAEEDKKLFMKEREKKNLKAVVEMQDEELARYIHEREIEESSMSRRDSKDKSKRKKQRSIKSHESHSHLHHDDKRTPPPHDHPRNLPSRPDPRRNGGSMRDERDRTNPPDRPPPPHTREEDETIPKSIHNFTPARRQVNRDHNADDSVHRRTKSERPRRPPQPSRDHHEFERRNSELSRDSLTSRDHPVSRDNPPSRDSPTSRDHHASRDSLTSRDEHRHKLNPKEERFRQATNNNNQHPAVDPDISDDIPYSERFARLAAQESWNYDQVPTEHMRKKNKGDCKQQ
ncbi:uncharacterized protein LOC100183971 [Ciona intestinalis]